MLITNLFMLILTCLLPIEGKREMWGHPTPRQGTAVPWNPAFDDLYIALISSGTRILNFTLI